MHHHIYPGSIHTKKPRSLDDLKTLVHHGCGIYGDFGAHIPVGMLKGLIFSSRRYAPLLPGAERPAGGREVNAGKLIFPRPKEALEYGRMLRVYWKYGGFVTRRSLHHKGSGGNQSFFVCKGDCLGGLDCSQRGFKPAEAHHCSHDNVYRAVLNQFTGGVNAQADIGPGKRIAHLIELGRIADDYVRHPESACLLNQEVCAVVGRYHIHGEPVRMLAHYIKGLSADRPRGAKNCDGFFHS